MQWTPGLLFVIHTLPINNVKPAAIIQTGLSSTLYVKMIFTKTRALRRYRAADYRQFSTFPTVQLAVLLLDMVLSSFSYTMHVNNGLVAGCHSFCLFSYFITYIHSFNHNTFIYPSPIACMGRTLLRRGLESTASFCSCWSISLKLRAF
jgi:hypothetical protein